VARSRLVAVIVVIAARAAVRVVVRAVAPAGRVKTTSVVAPVVAVPSRKRSPRA
jgi:hypothetical protein